MAQRMTRVGIVVLLVVGVLALVYIAVASHGAVHLSGH